MIIQGDALAVLRTLPAESVNCCVTSPPYWGLRDYGVEGQIGLEKTPEEYTARLVEVFREVRRVLRGDGTLWLNLGDSYSGGKTGRADAERNGVDGFTGGQKFKGEPFKQRGVPTGLKPKDLIGIPWRVAFALQADGWWLRSDIIWAKSNPMPESVTDRPTKAHEYIFLLSKAARYYYDAEAVREPFQTDSRENYPARATITGRGEQGAAAARGNDRDKSGGFPPRSGDGFAGRQGGSERVGPQSGGVGSAEWIPNPVGRNKRTVWTVSTCPTPEAHFATYPPDLIEPCILAGCRAGGTVLDPFAGAGTTGLACLKHGREFLGIELNPEYVEIARARGERLMPLLAAVQS